MSRRHQRKTFSLDDLIGGTVKAKKFTLGHRIMNECKRRGEIEVLLPTGIP